MGGAAVARHPRGAARERRRHPATALGGHWREFGRNYYSRHDYEEIDAEAAHALIRNLRDRLPQFAGQHGIKTTDDFAYDDPVDGSRSERQGVRLLFEDGSRIVYRLSGTGTAGATLRVYIERYEPNPDLQDLDTQKALSALISLACDIAEIEARTGRARPSVIT